MRVKLKSDNKSIGDQFESYVGTLYQSLGYRISYNVNLKGHQIDLLAEKVIPGAGQTKISIECKFQTDGNISNQKVSNFISVSDNLIKTEGITKSIMITNTGFTDTAWAAASKNQFVELMTLRSLEDQLFDLASTYKSFIETYESTDIFNEYVSLNGIYYGQRTKKKLNDVEGFLTSWLKSPQDQLMAIFGDFGSGKTTMLNRLKYILAKAYIQGQSNLKPFLINLKDFHKYDTVDKLLTYSAVREFEREVSLPLIHRQIETGQIILLLDGFDEMAQQVDTDIRMRNFLHLSPLLRQRTLITCRPSYFISKNEFLNYSEQLTQRSAFRDSVDSGNYTRKNMAQRELLNDLSVYLTREFLSPNSLKATELLDFETIELHTLSSESVDEYLHKNDLAFKRALGFDWIYIKNYLLQIYDISDLMTRPMLLKMIVTTLLSGRLGLRSKQTNVGPAGLYELYTSLYLDIDYNKGKSRQLFTAEQRRSFSISIALLMFEQRSLEVTYDKLISFIADHADLQQTLDNISNLTFEQIVADIQICTFLVSSDSGKFRFAHKSFMEFFVARYLMNRTSENKIPAEFFEMLPKEVLYFLGSFNTIDSDIRLRLEKWLEGNFENQENLKLARNLASTVLYSDSMISDLNWHGIEISYIEFKRKSLKNIRFDRINILHVEFVNAKLYSNQWFSTHLRQVSFLDCEIHNAILSLITNNVELSKVLIHSSDVSFAGDNLIINGSEIIDSAVAFNGNSVIDNSVFRVGSISWNTEFPCEVLFKKCIFDATQIDWSIESKFLKFGFNDCKFKNQTINLADSNLSLGFFERCEFTKCIIRSLRLDVKSIKTSVFNDCSGYVIVEDRAVEQELGPFKQSPDKLYVKAGDLWYISEKAWSLSFRDFSKFKNKYAKKIVKDS